MLQDIRHKNLRIFPLSTRDIFMATMPSLGSAYLISLLTQKIGMQINQIALETIYPTQKYSHFLLANIHTFPEEYFLFFLENTFHSNNYGLYFLEKVLAQMAKNGQKTKVLVHSFKCDAANIERIMSAYPNLVCFIHTDIEYFFYELLYKNTPLEQIANVWWKDEQTRAIHENIKEPVDYPLDEYLGQAYESGHIFWLEKHQNYLVSVLDEDNETTNKQLYYFGSKKQNIDRIKRNKERRWTQLSTGRWCKYACPYCYRGSKYQSVRQISLHTIQKDLDKIQDMGFLEVVLYDDCFLTTNANRLQEIADLLASYKLTYSITTRYEMCTPETLEIIKKIPFETVQMGIQSAKEETNKLMRRSANMENFAQVIEVFKERKVKTMLDVMLGLPGETLEDFKESLRQAISLKPWNISINTLFLNPGTELYSHQEEYGIVAQSPTDFDVPLIAGSTTFSAQDIAMAYEYVKKIREKCPEIYMVLR